MSDVEGILYTVVHMPNTSDFTSDDFLSTYLDLFPDEKELPSLVTPMTELEINHICFPSYDITLDVTDTTVQSIVNIIKRYGDDVLTVDLKDKTLYVWYDESILESNTVAFIDYDSESIDLD